MANAGQPLRYLGFPTGTREEKSPTFFIHVAILPAVETSDGTSRACSCSGRRQGRRGARPTWKAFLRDWDQVLNDSPPVGLATTTKVYKAVMGQQEHDEMLEALERDGRIGPGATIVEPTSGNTGIALAFVCAAKGYRCILTMPDSFSVERRKMLVYLGAELHLTPREKGIKAAIEKAEELVAGIGGAIMPMQFSNESNPAVHYSTTGPEIWRDTDGAVDVFVSGVGTGGTATGAASYLKEHKPSVQLVVVEPELSQVISGGEHSPHMIQGIGAGFVPDNLETDLIDELIEPAYAQKYGTTFAKLCQKSFLRDVVQPDLACVACNELRAPNMWVTNRLKRLHHHRFDRLHHSRQTAPV